MGVAAADISRIVILNYAGFTFSILADKTDGHFLHLFIPDYEVENSAVQMREDVVSAKYTSKFDKKELLIAFNKFSSNENYVMFKDVPQESHPKSLIRQPQQVSRALFVSSDNGVILSSAAVDKTDAYDLGLQLSGCKKEQLKVEFDGAKNVRISGRHSMDGFRFSTENVDIAEFSSAVEAFVMRIRLNERNDDKANRSSRGEKVGNGQTNISSTTPEIELSNWGADQRIKLYAKNVNINRLIGR